MGGRVAGLKNKGKEIRGPIPHSTSVSHPKSLPLTIPQEQKLGKGPGEGGSGRGETGGWFSCLVLSISHLPLPTEDSDHVFDHTLSMCMKFLLFLIFLHSLFLSLSWAL